MDFVVAAVEGLDGMQVAVSVSQQHWVAEQLNEISI